MARQALILYFTRNHIITPADRTAAAALASSGRVEFRNARYGSEGREKCDGVAGHVPAGLYDDVPRVDQGGTITIEPDAPATLSDRPKSRRQPPRTKGLVPPPASFTPRDPGDAPATTEQPQPQPQPGPAFPGAAGWTPQT